MSMFPVVNFSLFLPLSNDYSTLMRILQSITVTCTLLGQSLESNSLVVLLSVFSLSYTHTHTHTKFCFKKIRAILHGMLENYKWCMRFLKKKKMSFTKNQHTEYRCSWTALCKTKLWQLSPLNNGQHSLFEKKSQQAKPRKREKLPSFFRRWLLLPSRAELCTSHNGNIIHPLH